MYKYSILFGTFGTNSKHETSIYSSKSNLSTGMSDEVRKLIASREGIDVKNISVINKVTKVC